MTPPKKIILISLDTLRADHLGCYGYPRNTSPTLDALAQEGILFKNAFSPSSFTTPAHASIFTGKYPSHHSIGFNQGSGKLNPDIDITLAEILKSRNFFTAAFVSSIVLRKETNLGLGFDLYDDYQSSHELNRPDILMRECIETTQNAVKWLENNYQTDFFIFLHYMDIHGAYNCPVPFSKLFVDDKTYGERKIINSIVSNAQPIRGIPKYQILKAETNADGEIISFENDIRYYLAQYDGCIRYLDTNIGLFIEKLQQLGIYDDTLIIITSDHGEAFGENDIYFYHGLTVTLDQIKVPFIIKPHRDWNFDKTVIEEPVSTIDIFPTLLSLGNIALEDFEIDGISLKPLIENQYDALFSERTIMSENEGQYALISPHDTMEIRRKEIPTSSYYPSIPELIDSLHGKKFYWENGAEYPFNLPFDEFQRYRIVADIIKLYRKNDEIFTILDIGSGVRETLKKFLPNDTITNLDKEIPQKYIEKGNFIEQDITKEKINGSYDFVISIDTFEHISPECRETFLNTLIKSSQIATILASPFDTPGVKECEQNANNLYRSVYGEDYPWLKEHIQYGLPALSQTIDSIRKKGTFNISIIPNGYLPRWFKIIKLYLTNEKKPDVFNYFSTLWEFYNNNLYEFDNCDPAYRKIIVIPKSEIVPDFSSIFSYKNDPKKIKDLEEILNGIIKDIRINLELNDAINRRPDEFSMSIKEKDHLDQLLTERDNKIANLSHQILQLDALTKLQEKSLVSQKRQLEALTDESNNISIYTRGLEQRISQRDLQISVLSNQIQQVELHAEGLEQIVQGKDLEITNLTNQGEQLNIRLQELDQLIAERDNKIAILTHQILDINALTKSQENSLVSQKQQIEALTDEKKVLIEEKNRVNLHAYGLEQRISQRDMRISALSNQVQQIELHAKGLEQLVEKNRNNSRGSLLSGIIKRISNSFKLLFGKSRDLCKLGLKGGDIFLHEGYQEFIRQYKERKEFKNTEKKHRNPIQINNKILPVEEIDVNTLEFPENSKNPDISIVIPVHNQIQYTLNCLNSISKNTQESYEIVVVDDASSDSTITTLKKIKNITIIKNKHNLGFIRSCNTGASACRGKYILFLNNDTIVSENWLSPLLEIIKKDDVGAVGSKLVYPDGKLQEAGGIIWNDASGWNYGRGDNPEKPEYNFVRSVDYCSGAALLVNKEIFKRIGGFDERYIPAYYDDADLCFSIRELGNKVMYQPKSVIVHFEGVSSGTDLTTGIKHHQVINKEKFFQKWKDVLQKEHQNPGPENLFLAKTHSSGKTILVIDQYVPFFDRDAGSDRMYHILKILSELGHKVSFIGDNFHQFEPYSTIMQQSGIEVIYSPFITSIEQYLSEFGDKFDIVIVSRPYIAQKHIADIRKYCNHAKVIYDTVDLAFLRESRMAEVKKDPQLLVKADEIKKIELQLAKLSDITLVVSTKEQQILNNEDPSLNVQVISLIHMIMLPTKNFSERRDILFLGAFLHTPNADGALWFINEIFPKIKKQEPDIRIFIVGDRPTKEILALSSDDIIITGYVEDLSLYFNNCRVFVAPLRFGAGVKGKINQSMSRGLPVVTTSIGAEGMGIIDGENVLIADDPDIFSQKVIQLYNDENLWNTLSINSIEHIQKNTSYEQSKIRIKQFIDSL